jgi:peptidyl-dipeptidase A
MTQPNRTPGATTAAPHTHLPRILHVSIAVLACASLGLTTLLVAPRPLGAQDAAPTRMTLAGPPPTVRTEADLKAFLDDLESQEFAINTALGIETYYQWRGETSHRAAQTNALANDLLNRPDYAAIVNAWQGKVSDSTLARRVTLHARAFLQAKADPRLVLALASLQSAIQDSIEKFRYTFDGKQYTGTSLSEIVDTAGDRALRHRVFTAGSQRIPVIGPSVIRAMTLNDSIGRQEGFANGADAGLVLSTLTRVQVLHDLDAFERATRPAYMAMLARVRTDLHITRVEPWDIDYWLTLQERGVANAYPQAQGLPRLHDLFKALGFHADSLPIDVRVWDVPTGGITFPIRPPFEARLLTNPFTGSDFYETLFHEYGHALNATLMRPDLSPIFLAGDETPMSEGMAETVGHFAYDRHWLARAAHLTPAKAAALEAVGKEQLLLWLRRSICLNAWVEINAYADLHANLDSLSRESYQRFVGVELPPEMHFGDRDMFATGPLYFQSYLYANMIATQFRAAMRDQFHTTDLSSDPRVSTWLIKNVYADGGLVPWPAKILRATGHPLTVDALVAYLTAN